MADTTSGSDSDSQGHEPKVVKTYTSKEITYDIGLIQESKDAFIGEVSDEDFETIAEHLNDRSLEEAQEILREAVVYHDGDFNIGAEYLKFLDAISLGPINDQTEEQWAAIVKYHAFLIKDWSIYPAVRSVTKPIDEEEFEHYENIRVYFNSIFWSCAGSVLATFFAVRFPSISLSSVAVQILISYTGKIFEFIPDFTIPIGFKRRLHFGGGKWNFKEQMLATCGMGVGNSSPYSQYVVLAMANQYFYNYSEANNFGFIILLTLATNLMGFGLSGLFRVFLVYPTRLLWYGVLPGIQLSRTLVGNEERRPVRHDVDTSDDVHSEKSTESVYNPSLLTKFKSSGLIYAYYLYKLIPGLHPTPAMLAEAGARDRINGWYLKGWEFFWLFSILEFGWYWITDFLFLFLGYFDWVAWIAPHNNNLLAICGVNNGLAVNPFPTFDISLVTPSAMVTPFHSTLNTITGMIIGFLVIVGLWYKNTSYTAYLPINSNTLYDNEGNRFQVANLLNENHELDQEKYQNYSLPFWSAGALVSYGSFFAFYPAIIMYSILNYTGILWYSMKVFGKAIIHPAGVLKQFDDRFTRAQRKYKEVPEWWYLLFLAICLGMGIACVEHYKFTNTPVWTIFFGIGLSAVFMIPCGILYATTNTQVIINVLYELIIGVTNEGNGQALMVSKAFATNFMAETDNFISNLKQSHYAGLAPRAMFRIQIVTCICVSFAQAGLMFWQSTPGSIKDMCSPKAAATTKFTCQSIRTYFNAAVQWGTIGPRRVFDGLYPNMRYTFVVGALIPIPFYFARKLLTHYSRKQKWGSYKEGASRFRNFVYIRYLLSCEWFNSVNELLLISGGIQFAPYNFLYYWPQVYIGLVFQVLIPRYFPKWWQKYNYLLYAAISVGYSYSALIMFFATSYTHSASVDWWGNGTGISLTSEPRLDTTGVPDGYFGPRKGTYP